MEIPDICTFRVRCKMSLTITSKYNAWEVLKVSNIIFLFVIHVFKA